MNTPSDDKGLPEAGAISSDGFWYWDGAHWLSTISPDGLWKWGGAAWHPTSQSSTGYGPSPILPSPPIAPHRGLVIGSLLASIAVAAIVGGVAQESAASTGIADWQYLSILSGIVLLALLATLGLLARQPDWSRAFPSQPGGWRLPIATSTLAFGSYAVIVWLLLILGGILTVPDFLTGAGRGFGRDTLVGLLLLAGPALTLILVAATPYWRSLLLSPVPVRSASLWLLGIALLCGLLLLVVFSAEQSLGQGVAAVFALLVPPLVGFAGLVAKREWGRVTTTLACLCWAFTGFGLVFSVPLLLLLWLRTPMPLSPSSLQPPTSARMAAPQFSNDGKWSWNGQHWVAAISPDGRYRWTGTAWSPIQKMFLGDHANQAIFCAVAGLLCGILFPFGVYAGIRAYQELPWKRTQAIIGIVLNSVGCVLLILGIIYRASR